MTSVRREVGDADGKRPGQPVLQPAHPAVELLDPTEQRLDLVIDGAAFVGQLEPRATAAAEGQVQPRFKRRDVTGDGGEREVQLALCSGETACFDNSDEDAQKPHVIGVEGQSSLRSVSGAS
jgi:hypothetical protein